MVPLGEREVGEAKKMEFLCLSQGLLPLLLGDLAVFGTGSFYTELCPLLLRAGLESLGRGPEAGQTKAC